MNYFKHYLLGRRFIVPTDHRALSWMLNWKNPNTSQYCKWKQDLEIFEMTVQYRKGEMHANADALSRRPNCQQCELNHPHPKLKRNVKIIEDDAVQRVFCRRIVNVQEDIDQLTDNDLRTIIQLMKTGRSEEKEPDQLKSCGEDACIIWKKRNDLRFRGGLLYYFCDNNYRLIIPKDQRSKLTKMVHETLAHIGVNKTLNVLKEDYYWPRMEFDTRLWISSCKFCSERKSQGMHRKQEADLNANYPFHKVSLDITGPLPRGLQGEQYILGIIDNFSKFVSLVPLKRATAETVAHALYSKWVTLFGIPDVIHTDRGTEFENQVMYNLCNFLGIRKSKSSPYWPQGNSVVERLFRTVKDMLSTTMKSRNQNWVSILPSVEFALRCTVHRSTNFSPYEIIFGRKMRTPFSKVDSKSQSVKNNNTVCDFVKEIKHNNDVVHREIRNDQKLKLMKKTEKEILYPMGTMVMAKILPPVRGLNNPRYSGPYKIIVRKGKWNYTLEDETGKKIERNFHHLKPVRNIKMGNTQNMPRNEERPRYPKRAHSQPVRYGYEHA